MQVIKLYKYQRENGGVTVSPVKPKGEFIEMVRLVADEGKVLTKDGENFTSCVDTENADGWNEANLAEDEATEEDYQTALEDLGVNFDEENRIE